MNRKMFHTQECRGVLLTAPIKCIRRDAWLGEAYYFWHEFRDAKVWGKTSKKSTGKYEIYKSNINCENVLDTVFTEAHYEFWKEQVEKVADLISRATKKKATIKEINQYFKERAQWDEVDGIMFQDISLSPTSTKVNDFYYRKRIQLAVYNEDIILDFELYYQGNC